MLAKANVNCLSVQAEERNGVSQWQNRHSYELTRYVWEKVNLQCVCMFVQASKNFCFPCIQFWYGFKSTTPLNVMRTLVLTFFLLLFVYRFYLRCYFLRKSSFNINDEHHFSTETQPLFNWEIPKKTAAHCYCISLMKKNVLVETSFVSVLQVFFFSHSPRLLLFFFLFKLN